MIGALSHVALDHLTHDWGWLATNVDWYRQPIVDRTVLGRRWTPYRLAQYTGHVVLSAFVVWWLWRNGMKRWLAARAAQVPEHRSTIGAVVLAVAMVTGIAVSGAWVLADRAGSATDIMRIATGAFTGLAIGAAVARLASGPHRSARSLGDYHTS